MLATRGKRLRRGPRRWPSGQPGVGPPMLRQVPVRRTREYSGSTRLGAVRAQNGPPSTRRPTSPIQPRTHAQAAGQAPDRSGISQNCSNAPELPTAPGGAVEWIIESAPFRRSRGARPRSEVRRQERRQSRLASASVPFGLGRNPASTQQAGCIPREFQPRSPAWANP